VLQPHIEGIDFYL